MTLTEVFRDAAILGITNAITNSFWFFALYWTTKKLTEAANKLIKNFPHMLNQYEEMKNRQRVIDLAAMRGVR